jgi:hypothetical protein
MNAWIVDDDASIRWVLERALTDAGIAVRTFETVAAGSIPRSVSRAFARMVIRHTGSEVPLSRGNRYGGAGAGFRGGDRTRSAPRAGRVGARRNTASPNRCRGRVASIPDIDRSTSRSVSRAYIDLHRWIP